MKLLLGLSGRLARAENALASLPEDADSDHKVGFQLRITAAAARVLLVPNISVACIPQCLHFD